MTVELADTHCHLTTSELLPRHDQVVADARSAGVTRMITVACGSEEIEQARQLAEAHREIRFAAGIHPHTAAKADDPQLKRLAKVWADGQAVAAGEIGLDYHYDFSPRSVQQTVFQSQLELMMELSLPVVIHAREAHHDVVALLLRHGFRNRPVVFHCFSGTAQEAAEIRSNGWRVSFTGIITFKNASAVQEACAETPADEILFETDAPFLSPEPVRRMRPNEPCNLIHTVQFAAMLRGEKFEKLAAASTSNAIRFFNLDGEAS